MYTLECRRALLYSHSHRLVSPTVPRTQVFGAPETDTLSTELWGLVVDHIPTVLA